MIAESMLPEFDHEMASTRATLERVPDDKFGWKPHDRSYAMGDLATHIATLPNWTVVTIDQDDLDLSQPFDMPKATNRKELLDIFDKNVAAARAKLHGASDETLMAPWALKSGDQVHFSMPRVAVLRSFVMNHMIHHRAQLGVYLRINDVPLPQTYGPSADEGAM
jgi:uncharacterized damage-inducible protein DinB